MDLNKKIRSVRKLGLSLVYFGKDLRNYIEGSKESKECNIFAIFTRSGGDELYHPDTLSEGDMNELRNWIRCGDSTGLLPEWRKVDAIGFKLKVYLAGENPGIDCTTVKDDMFANDGEESYTYAYDMGSKELTKITHPQDYLNLTEHFGKLWRTAKDFSDLITLNRKFLSGQVPNTPYHYGPIFEETIPLVPGLQKLHDFRLLTINSQPYEQGYDESPEGYNEWQQRPYVTFIMPGNDGLYLEFFKKLEKRTDVVVFAEELYPFKILKGSFDSHVCSRWRKADTAKDLGTAAWKACLGVGSGADMSDTTLHDNDAMKSVKAVLFDVAASEWDVKLDLLGLVEEVAIECGLPRTS